SAGKRSQAFSAGERFDASLVFYPARSPLRALVAERRSESAPDKPWPTASTNAAADPLAAHVTGQDAAPWSSETPILLPAGTLARDERGALWWQADGAANGIALPIAAAPPEPALGVPLDAAVGLWDGARLDLLAAQSPF